MIGVPLDLRGADRVDSAHRNKPAPEAIQRTARGSPSTSRTHLALRRRAKRGQAGHYRADRDMGDSGNLRIVISSISRNINTVAVLLRQRGQEPFEHLFSDPTGFEFALPDRA